MQCLYARALISSCCREKLETASYPQAGVELCRVGVNRPQETVSHGHVCMLRVVHDTRELYYKHLKAKTEYKL